MDCGSAGGREPGREQLVQNTLESHYRREKKRPEASGGQSHSWNGVSCCHWATPRVSRSVCGLWLLVGGACSQGRGWKEDSHMGEEGRQPGGGGPSQGPPQLHIFHLLA